MKKHFALISVLMLLFLTTAGCIDIYLANEFLVPKKERKVVFEWHDLNFNHSFSSTPNEPVEIYNEQFDVEVKPKTKHMRINVEIEMRSIKEVWDAIPNGTIKDLLEELVGRLFEFADQRFIEITITMPDGFVIYNERFNQSADVELELISSPMEGNWVIDVEASGAGIEYDEISYHDFFSIDVVLNEIKE
jgi:hypothetical protein